MTQDELKDAEAAHVVEHYTRRALEENSFLESPAVVACPKCGNLECNCGTASVLAECNYLLNRTESCPRCNTKFHGMQRKTFFHSEHIWGEKQRARTRRIVESLDWITQCKRWRIARLSENYTTMEYFSIQSMAYIRTDNDDNERIVWWDIHNPPASMKHIIACIERDRDDTERLHRWRPPFDPRSHDKMYCPDCGVEMTKLFFRHEDGSGWVGGWRCECLPTKEEVAGHYGLPSAVVEGLE